MNPAVPRPFAVHYAPQLADYLPHTDTLPLHMQLLSQGRAWARDALHGALRPLLEPSSPTPVQVLAEARSTITRIEAALPAWSGALETFATRNAPGLQTRIQALPPEEHEAATAEALDAGFFGPRAPNRQGTWTEVDRFLRESLCGLRDRGYTDMDDAVNLLRGTLEDLPIEIRAIRLALARFALDVALGPCPTPEERRREELQLAHEVETIYGLGGFVLLSIENETREVTDLERIWDTSILYTPNALWRALRLPLPLWHLLADFLGRTPSDETRFGAWLYECACQIEETHSALRVLHRVHG